MKILAIRGANLASLEGEFELVLDTGPLAEAGVFAICGPTGAGKSTLLDAMCLALFDTAPRLDGRSRVRIGRDPEDDARITTTDPRSILRKGAGDGWAEVDFLGVDEEIYRARWEVRRARGRADGKLQPTVMKLVRRLARRPAEGCRRDVRDDGAAARAIDQFRRSVLLAQGDTSAVFSRPTRRTGPTSSKADDLDRAIYGAISQEAQRRARAARRSRSISRGACGAIALMSPEEREGPPSGVGISRSA
ncbi:MAG: AAA family ATPase [Sandaracinaceae bacterium]